jgi:integrase/recombinase XerC
MIITEAIEEFVRQKTVENRSPRTLMMYRKRLDSLVKHLQRSGALRLADVRDTDLHNWMLAMLQRDLKWSTRMGFASTVREFFRFAQERGWVLRNPSCDLPVTYDSDQPLPQPPLEESEVEALLADLPRADVIDLRNRAHIELLYGCALRLAESVALDISDVSFSRRLVVVRDGKGGKGREVPLMKGTAAAVKDYLAVRRTLLRGPDHEALLLNRRGKRLQDYVIGGVLREINRRRARGLTRLHPHLFRHSVAVHLLHGGADVRHVQMFLGHSSLETTKIYLRMVPGRLREDYDAAMPAIVINVIQ